MISVYYEFTGSKVLPGYTRTLCGKASRKAAQVGLMSVMRMVLNAEQRGAITSTKVNTPGMIEIDFTFRNGNRTQLTVFVK